MISDWLHRKFIENFFGFSNSIYYCSKITENPDEKSSTDTEKNFTDHPLGKGHRYRYYIPQVNPRINFFTPSPVGENLFEKTESTTKKKEHTDDRTLVENEAHEISLSKALIKIEKFTVIPADSKMTNEQLQIVKTGIIREVYPMVRHFLVVPLPNEYSHVNFLPKGHLQQSEIEKSTELDAKSRSGLKNKDSDHSLSDIVDNEYEFEEICETKESPRDYLLNTPFLEYSRADSSRTKNEEVFDTNLSADYHLSGTRELSGSQQEEDIDSAYLNDCLWNDLVDFDVPISHNKRHESSDAQKCGSSFMSIFKNLLFKANENEECDDSKR